MTMRTRSLLDLLLVLVLFALLAGIFLAAGHAIEWHVKAAVDAVQESDSNDESMMRVGSRGSPSGSDPLPRCPCISWPRGQHCSRSRHLWTTVLVAGASYTGQHDPIRNLHQQGRSFAAAAGARVLVLSAGRRNMCARESCRKAGALLGEATAWCDACDAASRRAHAKR